MAYLKVFLSYLFTFLCISPVSYFMGGWHFVGISCFSIVLSTAPSLYLYKNHAPIVTLGLAAGFFVTFSIKIITEYFMSLLLVLHAGMVLAGHDVLYFQYIFMITYAVVLSLMIFSTKKFAFIPVKYLLIAICLLFIVELVHLRLNVLADITDQFFISGILQGSLFALIIFSIQDKFIHPKTVFFYDVMQHVRLMSGPIIFFFTGFFLISIVFAGFYALIGQSYVTAFAPHNPASLGDYLYFSFNISSGLVDTNVTPFLPIAKWVVVLEEIASLVWLTIIIAAAISYIEKFLDNKKEA